MTFLIIFSDQPEGLMSVNLWGRFMSYFKNRGLRDRGQKRAASFLKASKWEAQPLTTTASNGRESFIDSFSSLCQNLSKFINEFLVKDDMPSFDR